MKLSEVLKDWPEKMKSLYPAEEIYPINYLKRDRDIHNTALTSCDREIDREALWKLIVSRSVYHNFDSDKDNFITVPLNDLTDLIISTMPIWLKRIENGKV